MKSLNDINTQVFSLLEDLHVYGMKSDPRGQKVVEAMVATLDIDPTLPIIELPDRPFNYKYFAGELAWFISRNTSVKFINNFSSFWNRITDNTNNVNSNYGNILLGPHPAGTNQLKWAYDSLVKDKFSRQAVCFLNSPYYQYPNNKDFVCTMYINFWIRNNKLDMKVQMRSNDIFFGLTYDAPWFSMIHQSMFMNLKKIYPELSLGMYYHCADNIHYYERHFELVNKIMNTPVPDEGYNSPKFVLKHPLFSFENDSFEITQEAATYLSTTAANVLENKEVDWKNHLNTLVDISSEIVSLEPQI